MLKTFYLKFTLETEGYRRSTRRPRYDGTPQLPGARKTSVNVKEATRQQLHQLAGLVRAAMRGNDWDVGRVTVEQLLAGVANGRLVGRAGLPAKRHADPGSGGGMLNAAAAKGRVRR